MDKEIMNQVMDEVMKRIGGPPGIPVARRSELARAKGKLPSSGFQPEPRFALKYGMILSYIRHSYCTGRRPGEGKTRKHVSNAATPAQDDHHGAYRADDDVFKYACGGNQGQG